MTADFDTAVDLVIKAITEADAADVHMDKSDVISLETDFIARLEAGDLPSGRADFSGCLTRGAAAPQGQSRGPGSPWPPGGGLGAVSSPTGAARTGKPPASYRKQPAGTRCAACG
jgi:hypothetical protein